MSIEARKALAEALVGKHESDNTGMVIKKGAWEDAQNYISTKNHSDRMWAWEFLRRNPLYKTYWEETIKEYYAICERMKKIGLKTNNRPSDLIGFGHGLTKEYLENIEEKEALYKSRIRITDISQNLEEKIGIVCSDATEKWGFMFVCNPNLKETPTYFRYDFDRTIYTNEDFHRNNIYLQKEQVAVTIRLDKPISPQIKRYSAELQKMQKNRKIEIKQTKDRGERVNFLRVLDSHNEGMKTKEAAKIIFPKKNNSTEHYQSQLKLAKKIVTKDYRKWL